MGRKERARKELDWDSVPLGHYALAIAYDGSQFYGNAYQDLETTPNAITVESELFVALHKAQMSPPRDQARFSRAGRTDRGVSARRNIAALLLREKRPGVPYDYAKILNRLLPWSVRIIGVQKVSLAFDARFSCLYREYKYVIPLQQIDFASFSLARLRAAARGLLGSHDFRNFCKIDVAAQQTHVRHVLAVDARFCDPIDLDDMEAEIVAGAAALAAGEAGSAESPLTVPEQEAARQARSRRASSLALVLTFRGMSFLWNQVRNMTQILMLIAHGKEGADLIPALLDLKRCAARPTYEPAPAEYLILWTCVYEELDWSESATREADNEAHAGEMLEESARLMERSLQLRVVAGRAPMKDRARPWAKSTHLAVLERPTGKTVDEKRAQLAARAGTVSSP